MEVLKYLLKLMNKKKLFFYSTALKKRTASPLNVMILYWTNIRLFNSNFGEVYLLRALSSL